MEQIKLLVVDDSLLMQRILEDLLKSDPQISVIGTARDGEEALSKISSLHPDVVTMDIEMPRMDGLTTVQKIMQTHPLPVIMISTLTQREAQITLKALEYGAVDYVPKPSVQISHNLNLIREELISKIKTAALANVACLKTEAYENSSLPAKSSDKIISITASTGGPPALSQVLKAFPADIPPILITQHMPKGITKLFSEGLNNGCKFRVKEAEEGDIVQDGLALIAPGGFHMKVNRERKINLTIDPPVNYVRPSGDVMMASLAEVYGSKNVGVILTGMGADGAQGIKAIKEKGGVTIAQDEKSCVVFGMPKVAVETGCVDIVAPLEKIPNEIIKACCDTR
jgi:two-component system, chemotaxis family, protein-glutamate methylesterase/glutaminase